MGSGIAAGDTCSGGATTSHYSLWAGGGEGSLLLYLP